MRIRKEIVPGELWNLPKRAQEPHDSTPIRAEFDPQGQNQSRIGATTTSMDRNGDAPPSRCSPGEQMETFIGAGPNAVIRATRNYLSLSE
jgi:hypothetical protein